MLASDIITRAASTLADTGNIRWPVAEHLNHINDAMREIVLVRPDAYSVTANLTLAGGTKQSIAALTPKPLRFLRAVRNMNVNNGGVLSGRAVREGSREVLDNELPDWHLASPAAVIQHFVFDNVTPTTFYVYPPANPGAVVEVVYSALPPAVSAAGETLALGDQYLAPLLDLVLYRCFSKDASYAGNMQRAQAHLQSASVALGVKMQAEFMAAASQLASPTPAAVPLARTGP